MTVPAFLASSFRYLELTGLTDVATVITSFRSETVTNGSPVWTEPSAGVFKSPVDAAGRFMEVTLTRISATVLEMALEDQTGFALCTRRANLELANGKCRIYTGQFHSVIEFEFNSAAWEILQAYIVDQGPDAQGSSSYYVTGTGLRSNAGSSDGQGGSVSYLFMKEDVTSVAAPRGIRWGNAATAVAYISAFGSYVFGPEHIYSKPDGTNARFSGRLYQIYVGDESHAFGTELSIPLDDVTVGTFRVLGLTTETNRRILCRKA